VFFCLSGCRPARHGENGRAQRAARHGQTAHGPCLGPKARHEHGAGTARQARRPVEARHRSGPARPDVPPGRAGTARWPCIRRRGHSGLTGSAGSTGPRPFTVKWLCQGCHLSPWTGTTWRDLLIGSCRSDYYRAVPLNGHGHLYAAWIGFNKLCSIVVHTLCNEY